MIYDFKKGFALLEVLISLAIFLVIATGIYTGFQFVFKVMYLSRVRILETVILNEQLEIVRNLPYENVGIINGSPSGVWERVATTTRSGLDFIITRTIRNIDDPYDGTIGGTPNDTAPADYKLTQVEIICSHCQQQNPLSLSTYIAPKNLEGDPTHGALFIEVTNAQAQPVVGALVHIVASATTSFDFTDVTDNEGMLKVVDLPSGNNIYQITVSKTGYTTDSTMAPTESVPNPVKPHASVVAQNVTSRAFAIDEISSINLTTLNNYCSPLASVGVNIMGTKLLGVEPDVLKVNQNIVTNGSGQYDWTNLEWDAYGLRSTNYDLLGAIPALPINLLAGANQSVQLILGANTANSLLINVEDGITHQPLSSASVQVVGSGYDQTKTTGVGFVRQTDWSGGTGQTLFIDETKYWSDDGKVENNDLAGDLKLKKVGQDYVGNGYLESSTFDLGTNVNFVELLWTPLAQPPEVGDSSVRWQIAASVSSSPSSWEYLGPDGTGNTYYDVQNTSISDVNNNKRYFRYKLFLQTASATNTPVVSDVTISYTTSCMPPGQAYFGGLTAQDYTVTVNHDAYQTKTQTITLNGDAVFGVEMVSE